MSKSHTPAARMVRHARQSWALAAERRHDATTDKARHKAQRQEGAARRQLLAALRFADLEA